MKKLILLTSVAILCLGNISESIAGIIASGDDCAAEGSTCHWEIDSNGKLTITGSGAMKNNSYKTFTENEVPDNRITTASYAQYWDKITSIEVGDKITTTGTNAFQGLSRVTTAKISADVKDLPNFAFDRMPSLSSITFGEGSKLTNIGTATFQLASSLQSIDIPKGVTSIGQNAFFNASSMNSVNFADDSQLQTIGISAFYNNQLTSVDIPEGVTSIGQNAFSNNQLTELTLPKGLTSIGYGAFYDNQLTSVNIPEGVTSIGDYAFYNNNLTELTLPEGLTSIGVGAFMIYPPDGNTHLNTLIIPDSVTSIGNAAFQGMGLSTVILPDSITSIADEAFGSDDSNDPIDSLKIICKGNSESCEKIKNLLQDACVNISGSGDDRKCDRSLNLANNVNLANESQCNSANYYWDGRTCNYEPDADSRVCDHEISGYIKVGNYCASPENTYAKKHYTPAEANQWLRDGNDNFVVLTFKK